MAKTHKVSNKFWIVARLQEINEGHQRMVSYHLLRTLENKGLIKPVSVKVTEGPGKPMKFHELTTAGKRYLNLSQFWFKPETAYKKAA